MSKAIYINLHPNYDYASAIVQPFIPELPDYVRLVEWLSRGMNYREIHIHANFPTNKVHDKGGHLNRGRVAVFIQRLEESGYTVYVRNERNTNENWRKYEYSRKSEEEMIAIESERIKTWNEAEWAARDFNRWFEFRDNDDEFVKNALDDAVIRLQELDAQEKARIKQLSEIWKEERKGIKNG